MSEMEELDKKAQEGLNKFKAEGGSDIQFDLDQRIDDLLGGTEASMNEKNQMPPSKTNFIPLAVLCGVFLLLIALWGYNSSKNKIAQTEHKAIFAQYFEPMDDISSNVNRGESIDQKESKKGMQFYAKKEYEQAANILLSNKKPESQFYGALSVLNSGDSERAISIFSTMQNSDSYSKYHDIINWYKALAYLSIGDKGSAKVEFQKISKENGYKSKEAKEILSKL